MLHPCLPVQSIVRSERHSTNLEHIKTRQAYLKASPYACVCMSAKAQAEKSRSYCSVARRRPLWASAEPQPTVLAWAVLYESHCFTPDSVGARAHEGSPHLIRAYLTFSCITARRNLLRHCNTRLAHWVPSTQPTTTNAGIYKCNGLCNVVVDRKRDFNRNVTVDLWICGNWKFEADTQTSHGDHIRPLPPASTPFSDHIRDCFLRAGYVPPCAQPANEGPRSMLSILWYIRFAGSIGNCCELTQNMTRCTLFRFSMGRCRRTTAPSSTGRGCSDRELSTKIEGRSGPGWQSEPYAMAVLEM